jgi:hypothetical protein
MDIIRYTMNGPWIYHYNRSPISSNIHIHFRKLRNFIFLQNVKWIFAFITTNTLILSILFLLSSFNWWIMKKLSYSGSKLSRVKRHNNYMGRQQRKLPITTEVAALVWGLASPCWRTIGFSPSMNAIDMWFQPLLGFHVSLRLDFHISDNVLIANDASVVPRNSQHAFYTWMLNLKFFISGRSRVTIFKWLACQFWVVVMHPSFIICDNAVQKIITLTSVASE